MHDLREMFFVFVELKTHHKTVSDAIINV